jgi:CRP/FNR family transcriptional regulator, cyclic AMP receptor protein
VTPRPIEILAVDSELAEGLPQSSRSAAQRDCLAPVIEIRSGMWDSATFESPDPGGFGMLVLSGFLTRRVGQRGRFCAELLGAGDLLRPWQTVGGTASIPFEPAWTTITDTKIAVLGAAFVQRASRYPEIAPQLVGRALLRSRYLAVNMAIVHQPRIETRLHMLFWHLADRWGRVRANEVALELPLTHALLGDLVAARRPTVSTALTALAKTGKVTRVAGGWTLQGGPPHELTELEAEDALAEPEQQSE